MGNARLFAVCPQLLAGDAPGGRRGFSWCKPQLPAVAALHDN